MLKDRKIIDWTQPVSSLADRPRMTAAALKAAFDSNTNQVKPALNGVIDDLTGTDGAMNIGTSPIDGVTGTDVQTMLAFLKGLIDLREPTENVDQKLALKADKAVTDKHVKTVSFDGKTGVFTFISEDGTSQTLDTMLEKVPVRCYLDGQTFVLVLEDGTEQRADLSAFLTETEFVDSETIDFAISDGSVRASVKAGSITLDMLESTVVSTLQGYMTAAQTAAENAKASETNAAAHRDAAAASETAAAQSASESRGQAAAAKSWAVGGTATRPGEDTDNAKYYAEKSRENASTAQGWSDTAMVHKDAAESSAIRAEQAAKDAEAIVGGDFIPMTQKGAADGVASLNANGKVPAEQLPEMDYDPAGSAAAVDAKLTTHADDKVKHITAEERTAWNAKQAGLTGKAGQFVGFTEDNVAGAVDAPSGSGGSMLTVTFDSSLAGLPWTIKGGGESYSGMVPTGLTLTQGLLAVETDYTLTVQGDKAYTRRVRTAAYFTALRVHIQPFAATITVTCPAGSAVTCANGGTTLRETATAGTAVFTVGNAGTWTITATLGAETATGTVSITADGENKALTLSYVNVYGVQWDGTSTTKLSRTDAAAKFVDPTPAVNNGTGSSPFDTLMPWAGMKRVRDAQAGELVEIPKYWYRWTKSGRSLKLQIADKKLDGFFVSPAHADRGDGKGERDVVYVGRYHCAAGYSSQNGVSLLVNITRSAVRSGIHGLGGTIWQWDWAMNWTIKMLYLVEFADWNSQTKIGYGCGNGSGTQAMGYTDSMQYHTGTTQASREAYGLGTQYRYIEGLWDSVYDWVDGCYYNSNGLNVILNPSKFSDNSNGVLVGLPTHGWPTKLEVTEKNGVQWVYPVAAGGSEKTYIPDYWNFSASSPCLLVGGSYGQSLNDGLFCVDCDGVSSVSADIGSRLMKLP